MELSSASRRSSDLAATGTPRRPAAIPAPRTLVRCTAHSSSRRNGPQAKVATARGAIRADTGSATSTTPGGGRWRRPNGRRAAPRTTRRARRCRAPSPPSPATTARPASRRGRSGAIRPRPRQRAAATGEDSAAADPFIRAPEARPHAAWMDRNLAPARRGAPCGGRGGVPQRLARDPALTTRRYREARVVSPRALDRIRAQLRARRATDATPAARRTLARARAPRRDAPVTRSFESPTRPL